MNSARSSGWSTKEGDGKPDGEAATSTARRATGATAANKDDEEYFLNLDEMKEFHKCSEEEQNNQQEVRISNEYYNRIIVVEYISVFLAGFGIGLSIILNELKLYGMITID